VETRLIHKRLGEKDRVTVPRLPIPAETAQIGGEDARGEVGWRIGVGEDHEANVLDDEASRERLVGSSQPMQAS
jgi:hypothetical protein